MSDKKRIASNSLFLVLLTFSSYFLGLLLYPYLSRVLSIENFGLFGFVTTFILIFQVIIEFGFMISATAKISEHRADVHKVSEIISATMQSKYLLAGISIVIFILCAVFLPIVSNHLLFTSLFFVSTVLSAMTPDFFYRGIEKMKAITIRTVGIRVLMIVLIVFMVKNDSHILLIPVSFVIANAIALIIAFYGVKKAGVKLTFVKSDKVIVTIKEGAMFFLSRLAVSINQSLGAIVLGLKFSPASPELGIFSGAMKISAASEMPITAVSDSLYPHMINKKDYRLFFKVLSVGIFVWFFVCLVFWIFAPQICVIVLGPEYAQAGDILRVLILGNFMAIFANWFGYPVLSPIGLANHANIAILVAALFCIASLSVLWFADSISLISVSLVMAFNNVIIFYYRGFIFWKNRRLTR